MEYGNFSTVVQNEINTLAKDVVENTSIPDSRVSLLYVKKIICYLESKYGFIRNLIRGYSVDDGVIYGRGDK